MILKDYLKNKTNLFGILAVGDLDFLAADKDALDTTLKINHGLKTLYTPFSDLSINELAAVLTANFASTWVDYKTLSDIEINSGVIVETTEVIENSETRNSENERINKLAAFNSDSMVEDSGENSENLENVEGETTKKVKQNTIDILAYNDALYTRARKSLYENILQDIANYLTISIY